MKEKPPFIFNKEYLIQLTNNLYRLTLLFPKKEPLRYKMRELADGILTKPNEKDLDVLDSFFEVALVQNWVSAPDILAVQREYDNLREELKKGSRDQKKENPVPIKVYPKAIPVLLVRHNSDRQEKIMEFLKENGKAQVWQIKQVLSGVSKRTLRRDFEQMLKQGIIERMGERNNTFYQIRPIQS